MFDDKSRYAKQIPYQARDRRGRLVSVTPVPPRPEEETLGFHVMREGQRVDHLAAHYLDNPAGFWRICAVNGVLLPEALTEAREVAIPTREK